MPESISPPQAPPIFQDQRDIFKSESTKESTNYCGSSAVGSSILTLKFFFFTGKNTSHALSLRAAQLAGSPSHSSDYLSRRTSTPSCARTNSLPAAFLPSIPPNPSTGFSGSPPAILCAAGSYRRYSHRILALGIRIRRMLVGCSRS
ncbi:uncharacterized protein LOC101210370 isoform X1 [Cucumis sativus]|uniref:uncharacterized protein LOC101210370 isoform X1 n=1 Tax=Cucumis sativus TaxID=3659 RepID=UPI0012F4E6AA|nr:uncharacterized protein LOC101210370 isoform X1 [Cucumis sativus]